MKVCLSCVEIFSFGKYGGFGRATRTIGRELVKRGIEVSAVVPRQRGQGPIEYLDGMTVYGFPKHAPWRSAPLFRRAGADIYHSSEPSLATYIAMKAMPDRKHIVTSRDPRDLRDWKKEFDYPALSKVQVLSNFVYERNLLVSRAVRRADAVYTTAQCLIPKVRRMYHLTRDPEFLATPVPIPPRVAKAPVPTVGFLARWDRVKRPELFLDLAAQFPDVRFIGAGASKDPQWDRHLRAKYSGLPNLAMPGFVDLFTSSLHSQILEESWVMVNTSAKEALPNAFLEAVAHRCAILAGVDPDSFASQFGYFVADKDFAKGLRFLLDRDRWRYKGERGFAHVSRVFETTKAIDDHLRAYERVLTRPVRLVPLA